MARIFFLTVNNVNNNNNNNNNNKHTVPETLPSQSNKIRYQGGFKNPNFSTLWLLGKL